MKTILVSSIALLFCLSSFSQKRYFTRNGHISFNAGTALEDIDAFSNAASSVLDISTGQIEFATLIKSFEFKRALMQDHFNENYMESDKYPKSVFRGKIVNLDKVDFRKDGLYPVKAKGFLEMHGVSKEVETTGTLNITGETIQANALFTILLSDYNISVPGLVKDKISKSVSITVKCNYTMLK